MRLTHRNGAMEAGSTGDEEQTAASPDLTHVVLDATEDNVFCVKADTAPHRVDHRLWLLKDLLLHEGTETAWKWKWLNTL